MSHDAGGKSALSEMLGPLPEPDLQTDPCSAAGTQTDYYTAGTLRRLLAAERERCAKLRSLLQGAEMLFAPLCRDATAWNWLDEARAALAETEGPNVALSR